MTANSCNSAVQLRIFVALVRFDTFSRAIVCVAVICTGIESSPNVAGDSPARRSAVRVNSSIVARCSACLIWNCVALNAVPSVTPFPSMSTDWKISWSSSNADPLPGPRFCVHADGTIRRPFASRTSRIHDEYASSIWSKMSSAVA